MEKKKQRQPLQAQKRRHQALWIAIRLTHFSLESLGVARGNKNIMVSYKQRICAYTDNLQNFGIQLGTPTATAQLLQQTDDATPCRIYERELDSEDKSLQELCDDFYSVSPHIEVYRVDTQKGCDDIGILLEISRCIALFKSVQAIADEITKILQHNHFSHQIASGHSKQMAWLLSYREYLNNAHPYEEAALDSTRSEYIQALKNLPLDLVYEFPQVIQQLKKSGFFSFADLIQHIETSSFQSLRKRFGEAFCNYIADTLDMSGEIQQNSLFKAPVPQYQPKQIFLESIQFDHPVSNCEQLDQPIKTLLTYLTKELTKKQQQTQHIQWHLYDIYHNQESFPVHFERIHNNAQLAVELTMIRFEHQALPFAVDTLELFCDKLLPVNFETISCNPRQTHNNIRGNIEKHALATVTAKLNARLGENAVYALSPKDSHIPELSYRTNPIESSQSFSPTEIPNTHTDRPSWIFKIPILIGKRQNTLFWKGKLELLQGPERIEGLWWKKPTARDYFVARRDDNVRLWVFHDLYKDEWYAHGVFS
ncbi:MAG: hypothetical protein K6L76_05520 [Agarilytica sp.]